MNKKPYKKNFTPSDDALIREQPVTGINLKVLATRLGRTPDTVMRRAHELGVSLVIGDEHDDVDPLLERLKRVHDDR